MTRDWHNEQIRFAIVGAGNIGRVTAQAVAAVPGTRVSVVCDLAASAARKLAETCGAAWETNAERAVERSDVDAVCVCTPSGRHAEVALAAAQAGKHLWIEKPMEITLPRIDEIIRAAEALGVRLTSVFPYRFMRGSQVAAEAVRQGRLGKLVLAEAVVKWHRSQAYYDGSWHGTWKLDGGGALMNQAIHSIDLLQWLAGPVANVFARTATRAHQMETEDTAAAVLAFANGALGGLQGSTACFPGQKARVSLHGDRGTIELEEGRIITWKLNDAPPGEEAERLAVEQAETSGSQSPTGLGYEMHRRQMAGFVEALRNDSPPAISGAEARKSVEIIRAIYHSARLGQSVNLPYADEG
jgi:UDP-N-acetyl-2-amino-2-deoxyglucuronate dehydrogenase